MRTRRSTATLLLAGGAVATALTYQAPLSVFGQEKAPRPLITIPRTSVRLASYTAHAVQNAVGPPVSVGVPGIGMVGIVQVQITRNGSQVTSVQAISAPPTGDTAAPNTEATSASISNFAVPVLDQEAVQAQSAQIDTVSGATYTSDGFITSLQGALSQPVLPEVVGMASTPSGRGYWLVSSNGAVAAHGDAASYGDMSTAALNRPIVGMAPTADGKGYWLDASDGGIFSFGDAQFYGSMGGARLNQPMVGMASTPDGKGYWTVAADGGIFSFGDAHFYGSTGSIHLNMPVVGMAVDNVTGGYWLVASDGGIFSFNAPFYGSTGNIHLNKPIVEMEAAPTGGGYRFVASDGGVFCANLPFEGSLGGNPPPDPIAGMAASGVNGYWLVDQNGTVTAFGSAPGV